MLFLVLYKNRTDWSNINMFMKIHPETQKKFPLPAFTAVKGLSNLSWLQLRIYFSHCGWSCGRRNFSSIPTLNQESKLTKEEKQKELSPRDVTANRAETHFYFYQEQIESYNKFPELQKPQKFIQLELEQLLVTSCYTTTKPEMLLHIHFKSDEKSGSSPRQRSGVCCSSISQTH